MTSNLERLWNANIHYHPVVLASIPREARRVLDVGCGDGILSAALARAGVQHVGALDLDAGVLSRGRRRATWTERSRGVVAVIGLAANDWWDLPYAAMAGGAQFVLSMFRGYWEHSAPIA